MHADAAGAYVLCLRPKHPRHEKNCLAHQPTSPNALQVRNKATTHSMRTVSATALHVPEWQGDTGLQSICCCVVVLPQGDRDGFEYQGVLVENGLFEN